jgi:hypothetical protein
MAPPAAINAQSGDHQHGSPNDDNQPLNQDGEL